MKGEVSTRRFLCHDGLTVSGTCLRRIRDVDMKRDFAFVVCISLPYPSYPSFLVFLTFLSVLAQTNLCGLANMILSCAFSFDLWLQEFSDPRDADDARYSLNGRDVDGSRIIVEFAKGVCVM